MKAVCLLSGGIDSPVAIQIAILNGFQPAILHYHNYPFQSLGTLEKVLTLSNALADRNPDVPMTLAIMQHGRTQETVLNILEDSDIRQTCLFCRMQMFSKAQTYAHQVGADIIVTGEILGEQASQTLDNLPIVVSKVDILTLRPLLGYNKEEVIQLSREWGLYDISILPGGCCSINPRYPETQGRLEVVDTIYRRFTDQFRSVMDKEVNAVEIFSLPVRPESVLSQIET